MSACYHICPNHYNFQFGKWQGQRRRNSIFFICFFNTLMLIINFMLFVTDTSFMYVICTLCMIKIYQTRHPDINAASYATFFLLAGVIFIGMCGVFSENLIFRILFTILHLVTCYYISVKIYYMGRWKLSKFVTHFYTSRTVPCNLLTCFSLDF